ncbi:YihY/virulence factor BrkB family protein [Streptomyces marincola]|uniref:YihY/virulence factor BrkB family protein n=1 Tax=Streptomyces marincola TaxID=2878388 RepID=UPI00384AA4B8
MSGALDRLTRLPGIGPAVAWFLRSRAWHVYEHLDERKWTRLAAAITFTSFVTLFPLLGLAAATGAALLTDGQLRDIEEWASDQVPGISDQLDLGSLFEHAGTIGVVSLALVLPTGAAWVDALRSCLRELWDLADPEDNIVVRRLRDVGVLAGLGGVTLVSLGVSALGMSAVHWASARTGTAWPFQLAAYLLAMVVTFFLLTYLLVWLPGVRPPRADTLVACAMGAVGFELLKQLLGGYLTEVATRNVYGAFGVPVALLVWINLMAKLLLVCCAWTATALTPAERPRADAMDAEPGPEAAADGGGGTATPPPRERRSPPP